MEIPYSFKERKDTGLYNGKVGIWLFLASEVMLFGALFSAYVLLRVGAEAGTWSMGLMNQWVGAFNTLILIASSATIVMAWVCLKLKDFAGYRKWQWITILFASAFLIVKWGYEWPAKFTHYDITFKDNQSAKKVYRNLLGDKYATIQRDVWEHRYDRRKEKFDGMDLKDMPLDGHIVGYIDSKGKEHKVDAAFGVSFWSHAFVWRYDRKNTIRDENGTITSFKEGVKADTFRDKDVVKIIFEPYHGTWFKDDKEKEASSRNIQYAEAGDAKSDTGHSHSHTITIDRADISRLACYEPAHSTFFATYYTLTGLHALHVFGGILVMLYHLLPISQRVYNANPEQFTNRIEITGLFWHFVDLVWIFLFPILYLL